MNTKDIDLIHKKYRDYYEGYILIGSYKLFLPYYKVIMKMSYITESPLNMVEEFICKCIDRDINTEKDICKVLALDSNIYHYIITELLNKDYLICDNEKFAFTKQGRELFNRSVKLEEKDKNVIWYYDGLLPQYGVEFFDREEQHLFMSFRDIEKKGDAILITPKTFPEYMPELHYKELSHTVQKYYSEKSSEEDEKTISIRAFKMINEKEVQYHEHVIMMFRNEQNKYKLLAYDPCCHLDINQRVTKNLLKLYDTGSLKEMMHSESNKSVKELLSAFENYSVDLILEETFEDEERAENYEGDKEVYSTYIMNYEIREKFIHFLKNAKESLYIISPWMNNYIVNNEFIEDIENLLKRNVKVRIIYGISSSEDIDKDHRNRKTEEIAEKLRKLGEAYEGLLKVEHGQTHEKLCICDGKYYINGSFNFLSYSGEDNGGFRNEGSTYTEDERLIRAVIRKRFGE